MFLFLCFVSCVFLIISNSPDLVHQNNPPSPAQNEHSSNIHRQQTLDFPRWVCPSSDESLPHSQDKCSLSKAPHHMHSNIEATTSRAWCNAEIRNSLAGHTYKRETWKNMSITCNNLSICKYKNEHIYIHTSNHIYIYINNPYILVCSHCQWGEGRFHFYTLLVVFLKWFHVAKQKPAKFLQPIGPNHAAQPFKLRHLWNKRNTGSEPSPKTASNKQGHVKSWNCGNFAARSWRGPTKSLSCLHPCSHIAAKSWS